MRRMYSENQLKEKTINSVNEAIESGEINANSKLLISDVKRTFESDTSVKLEFPKGKIPLIIRISSNDGTMWIDFKGGNYEIYGDELGYEISAYTFNGNESVLYLDCADLIQSFVITGIAYCNVVGELLLDY